jgi:hypothetical protein
LHRKGIGIGGTKIQKWGSQGLIHGIKKDNTQMGWEEQVREK